MELDAMFFDAFRGRARPAPGGIVLPAAAEHDGAALAAFLASLTPDELTDADLRAQVEGKLWLLTPEAFLYFLPAFMRAALRSYASVSVFASELVGALTAPDRLDIIQSMDRLAARSPSSAGLPPEATNRLREDQLAWFDGGAPTALFNARFGALSREEGTAVLAFLEAFEQAHGADFPFDELQVAIDRYWQRYR